MCGLWFALVVLAATATARAAKLQSLPNLVILLTDDLGFNAPGTKSFLCNFVARPGSEKTIHLSLLAGASLHAPLHNLTQRLPGFRNPDLFTPTLDRLATKQGVILENFYTYRFCSPTRGSLLTGRFPYKLQSPETNFIPWSKPVGTHLGFTMLPAKLKAAGYATAHIGRCEAHPGSPSDGIAGIRLIPPRLRPFA